MASKSKKSSQEASRRKELRKRRYSYLAIGIVVVIAMTLGATLINRPQSLTPAELGQMVGDRFRVELDGIVNDQTLPSSVRGKIQALFAANVSNRLEFRIDMAGDGTTLAAAVTTDPKPAIAIMGPRFMQFQQEQSPRLFRSSLIAFLFHESKHLELWPEKPGFEPTPQQKLDEEVRAYSATSLDVVRPLAKAGWPVMLDYMELDQILQHCGDDPQCAQFRQAIETYNAGNWPKR